MERLSSYEADRLNDALYGMDEGGEAQAQVSARYVRTDSDGTAWVRLEGADKDTPLTSAMSVTAREGDLIDVRLGGYEAVGGGNRTDPSAGVARVALVENLARDTAEESARTALAVVSAQQTADEANKVAQATNQHFFADTNGAHITDVTQDEWNDAVADEFSDYDPDTKPYHNQLLNSLGILLRTALNNLVSITRRAIAFYDGTGNAASNIVARFGADGAQVGVADGLHTVIDGDSFDMFTDEAESNSIFHVGYPTGATVTDTFVGNGTTTGYMLSNTPSDTVSVTIDGTATSAFSVSGTTLTMTTAPASGEVIAASYPTAAYIPYYTLGVRGGNAGEYSTAEGYNTTASGPFSHAEGRQTTASGSCGHAEGSHTTASGWFSHAEGYRTTASGWYSHAEGDTTTASGDCGHAEGRQTTASGSCSRAEGYNTTASGSCSRAEGSQTTASGWYSHAEGDITTASGWGSHAEGTLTAAVASSAHAEGDMTTASGWGSHAQNIGTVSARDAQTVIGTYNSEDTATTTTHPSRDSDYGEYALVIGNGTGDDNRSNALAVDWDGYIYRNDETAHIGSTVTTAPNAVSCSNNTWKSTASVTLSEGTWVVMYGGSFVSNATGRRGMHLGTTAPGAGRYSPMVHAVNGDQTRMNAALLQKPSADTTYYLYAIQSSGSSLDFYPYIQAVKIC